MLTLRKPYANGTTDFLFSEGELAQKLAALDETWDAPMLLVLGAELSPQVWEVDRGLVGQVGSQPPGQDHEQPPAGSPLRNTDHWAGSA